MANPVCYSVNRKIDGYIASKFGWSSETKGSVGLNAAKVASLRAQYDRKALENGTEPLLPNNPTDADLDKAADKLLNFRVALQKEHQRSLSYNLKHISRAYDALRHAFSLHERKSRVNMISTLFSEEVDRLMVGSNADRQSFINGFTTITGEHVGGEFSILEGVYNIIHQIRSNWWQKMEEADKYFPIYQEKGELKFKGAPTNIIEFKQMCEHRFNECTKMIECWDELIPFVLKDLVQKEGVKLGVKKEFVANPSSDNFGANDIASKWEMSEAVRDGWQKNNDLESAYGSVGQQVRRILSTIPEMEVVVRDYVHTNADGTKELKKAVEYQPVVDDMGNQVFIDPVKTHQALQEMLRGVTGDSNAMIAKLCKEGKSASAIMGVPKATATAKVFWMQPIVDLLLSDPQARTQFFHDFRKNFQPYSVMWEDSRLDHGFIKGIKNIKTKVLNLETNVLEGRYKMIMSSKGKFPANVTVWGYKPIFSSGSEGTEVDWDRFAELRQKVLAYVTEPKVEQTGIAGSKIYGISSSPLTNGKRDATVKLNGKNQRLTYDMRRDFLMEAFSSLGFDVTMDTVDNILSSKDIWKVREELEKLFDPDGNSGILSVAGKKSLGATQIQELKNQHILFKSLYKKSNGHGKPVEEHINKLLTIISGYQEGKRIESRARYQGNTMYSYVAPSYLGDKLETIQGYVDDNNHAGLLSFLKEEYLCSPFFVDNEYLATDGAVGPSHILNTWLADLVSACLDTETNLQDSVAAIFNFERDLGSEDKPFEDFTSKEHGEDMLIHFFADEQQNKGYGGKGIRDINKKLSAMYPVFILGDAGVSKYIRAPRISSAYRVSRKSGKEVEENTKEDYIINYRFDQDAQDKIVNAFYNIYIQEKRRMAIEKALSLNMYANGKEVKHNEGEFSILTFLNPDSQDYQSKYAIPAGNDNDVAVKKVIREYLNDATKRFQDRIKALGILDTVEIGKDKNKKTLFKNINSIATPENIDSKIQEFFWNTKLATAEQLQLMTIDPSFYHGTKDLQKRYKEIHAPGNVLDVLAEDINGNLYSEDGMEHVAYIDDEEINSEKTNSEFMDTIKRIFKGSPNEDKIVKKYKENTLTDGQGWRTLTSYRKVKGMAGEWTRGMENAYQAIMDIRDRHKDGSDVTEDELRQIASFAVKLQPIKPYMFTHEKVEIETVVKKDLNGNISHDPNTDNPVSIKSYALIPVQHKYAEALIIPELLPKGNKLRDLAYWMDANNVDMVGSTKIAKVGCFGQVSLKGVTDANSLNTAMSGAKIHLLPYKDYRIQTNVPEHINSSQLFGTQVRKLIMSGLDLKNGGDYYRSYLEGLKGFNGTVNLSTSDEGNDANSKASLNGRNLLALYNSLICANIFDSYNSFAQNVGNIENLANVLQQSTVSSIREAMDNLFSYVVTGNEDPSFLIPLFEGGLEHDSAALILSTFKKIVNKQQISGGSAVQVSAFGIDGYKEDGGLRFVTDPNNDKNILYAEIEMPFDKSFMMDVRNADGTVTKTPVQLDYYKYCNLDGTLIPTDEVIQKGTREWTKYQSYTYKKVNGKLVPCDYNDAQAEVHKPLIEVEYPDILSILAYRIPTERDYSMLNCQIKRFSNSMAGGTIKVPPEGTTIAGFDFDIDKLYFMQREYHKHYNEKLYTEDYFDSDSRLSVWTSFFTENPEIMQVLSEARAEAEAKDPTLVTLKPILNKNGEETGRFRTIHHTTLNSYWEQAEITKNFGIEKGDAFAKTAQKEGIVPTQNTHKEATEWLEEYHFDLPPEDPRNTRAARNNLLITLIQARLTDPNTAKQRYTPGGFDNASEAARQMRILQFFNTDKIAPNGKVDWNEIDNISKKIKDKNDPLQDPEPNYDPTDPYTMLVYNQQNQVASKLIGIFANQNTNYAFSSSMDVFELYDPISFCGHSFSNLLHKNPDEAAEIDLNMAEFLAASVDAVKDPVLNFLNLNTITADAGALLARLGYNTKEIGLLFNQPVIKNVCNISFNEDKNIATAINEVKRTLKDNLPGYTINSNTNISQDDLALGIIGERQAIEMGLTQEDYIRDNARMQMAVLDLFERILKASNDVSQFVLSTKFTASNAVSSTMGGMYAQQEKVNDYVDKFPANEKDKGSLSYRIVVAQGASGTGLQNMPIDNNDSYLGMSKKQYLHQVRFNPFAYEQAMYDANRKAIKLLSKYYPYETSMYSTIRSKMASLSRFGTLSEDDINAIHSNIPVALLAKQTGSLFDGECEHVKEGKGIGLTNREYYKEQFAKDLQDMISEDPDGLGSLEIFKYIIPSSEEVVVGKDANGMEITKEIHKIQLQDIGGMDADTKEAIRESWAYMMEVKDDGYFGNVDYATLGRDLFMYCFYQLGFDFSPLSFMHLAPTAVKDSITVKRSHRLPVNSFNECSSKTDGGKPTDDVLVWSPGVFGSREKALDEFGGNTSIVGALTGMSYQLPDVLDIESVSSLLDEASSHPELKFKIDRLLTEDEFKLFTDKILPKGKFVPSNIYFSNDTFEANRELHDSVPYGVGRSYREFLKDILSGKEDNLNPDEFAQMFILNHLDNPKYVLDVYKCNKTLSEMIKKQIPGNLSNTETITLDVSRYQNDSDKEALKGLVGISKLNGEITSCKWSPVIKIGNYYYMANGDAGSFSENRSLTMTYRKVTPWGTSKQMDYDGDKKLSPTLRYQSSLNVEVTHNQDYQNPSEQTPSDIKDGVGEPQTDPLNNDVSSLDKILKDMQDYIFNEYVKAIEYQNQMPMSEEDKEGLQREINNHGFEDIAESVRMIRNAVRENGVIVLDDQGNPVPSC